MSSFLETIPTYVFEDYLERKNDYEVMAILSLCNKDYYHTFQNKIVPGLIEDFRRVCPEYVELLEEVTQLPFRTLLIHSDIKPIPFLQAIKNLQGVSSIPSGQRFRYLLDDFLHCTLFYRNESEDRPGIIHNTLCLICILSKFVERHIHPKKKDLQLWVMHFLYDYVWICHEQDERTPFMDTFFFRQLLIINIHTILQRKYMYDMGNTRGYSLLRIAQKVFSILKY